MYGKTPVVIPDLVGTQVNPIPTKSILSPASNPWAVEVVTVESPMVWS